MIKEKAVRLNPDEIMKHFFGEYLGDRHDEVLQQTLNFIYYKALEIYHSGINVVIDFGFWQKQYRKQTNQFFTENNVKIEWHYIDINDATWKKNIKKRNKLVAENESFDYFVDEGILNKFMNPDDKPEYDEMDIWYENNW